MSKIVIHYKPNRQTHGRELEYHNSYWINERAGEKEFLLYIGYRCNNKVWFTIYGWSGYGDFGGAIDALKQIDLWLREEARNLVEILTT